MTRKKTKEMFLGILSKNRNQKGLEAMTLGPKTALKKNKTATQTKK